MSLPDSLLHRIRPAVRAQRPYIVGGLHAPPIKLNQNESPFDVPETLKKKLYDQFFSIPFNRYPKEQPERLRQKLADHIGCSPAQLLLGNGSNELTHTLGLCLVESGVNVVLPTPMFSLYTSVVRLFGGNLIPVPPRPDLHFDVAALIKAIQTHDPTLTIITTPNNPTGLALTLHDVTAIVEATQGFVVVDEAYVEFSEEESAYALLDTHPNVILMRTFSKAFGLAGLRLGYMIGHEDVIANFMKSRLPFMIDQLAESVALTLLENSEMVSERVEILKNGCRELALALAKMSGIDVVHGQANFLLFKTPENSEIIMKKLSERGVLVRNMNGYPELAGYLRVNAGLPEENKAFLHALEDALISHD